MRQEPATLPTLVTEIRAVYGSDADIWLFGSCTDDQAKGGDIDLYVEASDDFSVLDRYLECRRRLFQLFGNRKIDLVIRPRGREPSPIERIARKTGIKLSDKLAV